METSIDKLWDEYNSIKTKLTDLREISLLNDYTNTMRKVLILSCGSFFEKEITELLKDFIAKETNNNTKIINLMEQQVLKQKYHTLFDWGKQDVPSQPTKSANKFWGLFGQDFKTNIINDLKNKDNETKSMEAFIELGHVRNILVHSDFASYNYDEKTPEEIYELYNKAKEFVIYIKTQLNK